ncbi:hypothetical protein V5O48_001190 [Marasmius crinis-equi]|uniref:Chromatin remodeling factor mit1 n=1 Tax=Marasmius crinis-equi TaxID=585013 RepID=A0ABR3FZ29_9AGAR
MADSKPIQKSFKSRNTFYVEPPILSETQKAKYMELPLTEEGFPVDEVVGELLTEKGRLLYYGRYQGGIIRGYNAKAFAKTHKEVLDAYELKKAEGELEDFDPSTDKQVHPAHRVSITMNLDLKRKRVTRLSISSTSSSRYKTRDSDEDPDSEAVSDGEFDASSAYDSAPPSRTTRSKLLSPRKTRSRKVIPIDDDEGEGPSTNLRRSTRSNQALRISLEEDAYYDDSQTDEDSDTFVGPRSSRRKSKCSKPQKKAVPPEYGKFRSVEDVVGNDEDPLLAHRPRCEKCFRFAAHKELVSLKKKSNKGKRRARNKDTDEESSSDEEDRFQRKGGWVRCLKCPVSAHWGCLAKTQQEEILRATRQRDQEEWSKSQESTNENAPPRRQTLDVNQTTEFICGSCMKGGMCMGCMETALEANPSAPERKTTLLPEDTAEHDVDANAQDSHQLLFRCLTCKRLAHYEHLLKDSEGYDVADVAKSHQHNWLCPDCASYRWTLDKILAWRPYPANAVEPPRTENEPVNYKSQLPREYLVKWAEKGYRRTQWVPHMWLLSTYPQKLRNFLLDGPKVRLLLEPRKRAVEKPAQPDTLPFDSEIPDSRASTPKLPGVKTPIPYTALPDAEDRIPLPWLTIDRVLNVQLRRPRTTNKQKKNGKRIRKVIESEEDEDMNEEDNKVYRLAYDHSEEPSGFTETVEEFETRVGRPFDEEDIDLVVWGLFKWDDLSYAEATSDSPPRQEDETYDAFRRAMLRYIAARRVEIQKPSQFDKSPYGKLNRKQDAFRGQHALKNAEDLDLGQDPKLKLMPFQVDGFNWLCDNWWNQQPCILADEMGLGKTVQITSFLGKIITNYNAAPALVVVPNSTVTNWIREFERWAPALRVVPFYGDADSRKMIKTFELYHEDTRARKLGMKTKFHVLVTTYEAITHKTDFGAVFKAQPRWEVLVIDEGQRLKSDSSLLFNKLNELNTGHRIIMTGTPLNNNIRELFNLMNFLDPNEWSDLKALEKEHEELTEELVKDLHVRLRPYFLRRIKSEVLQLPPKVGHNADLLSGLVTSSATSGNTSGRKTINNMLMQLRKCLQHPYLYDQEIEPRDLSSQEAHEKLIDASGKLRFLRSLLPRLRSRGHRFVIALDVIEDFLVGEGIKYLRLDGNTAGHERQKGMDEFNRPGSDIFIYLLTTRAGGVGINLFTADTVIVFDPDFNPHQDLQAIARAHRFGQQKTVLVFKLMVKQSAEERIVQIGKKKMVLDHLIVQKMEDDDDVGADVQSILMYGAQALFNEGEESSKDIVYSDNDIDNLIEKTEKEGDAEEVPREGATSFSFAKIWTSDKDGLEEVRDENQEDSWALTLQKLQTEMELVKAKEAAQFGRGVRRKATAAVPKAPDVDLPPDTSIKKSKKKRPESDGDSAYNGSEAAAESDSNTSESDEYEDRTFKPNITTNGAASRASEPKEPCGLCGQYHTDDSDCVMTDKSENLAEFREMLITNAGDESWDERIAAIRAIEETLMRRGDLHLIRGQPLHPVKPVAPIAQLQVPPQPHQITSASAGPSKPAPNGYSRPSATKPSPKRPLSPTNDNPAKKMKQQPTICGVCGNGTHILENCPVVQRGPTSTLNAIMKLENVPGTAEITSELRRIHKKQKKLQKTRESQPQAGPSGQIIELE